MPITFDHLAGVITKRRFTPDEQVALKALSEDERDRLIVHTQQQLAYLLANATVAGHA